MVWLEWIWVQEVYLDFLLRGATWEECNWRFDRPESSLMSSQAYSKKSGDPGDGLGVGEEWG